MGLDLDKRTDVYALATLFYEMVTGYHPDEGTYRPINEIRPDSTPTLDMVIDKARNLVLEKRYPDINQFCTSLQQAIDTQPGSAMAPAWRRIIARYQSWLHHVSFDYWWIILLASVGLGWLSSNSSVPNLPRIIFRAMTMAGWGTVLLNIILTLYTTSRARQTGYFTLSTFGGAIATVLTFYCTTLVAILTYTSQEADDFLYDLIFISFAVFLIGILNISVIFAITRWASRRSLGENQVLTALSTVVGLFLAILFIIFYFLFR
jgi:hypothetical protein